MWECENKKNKNKNISKEKELQLLKKERIRSQNKIMNIIKHWDGAYRTFRFEEWVGDWKNVLWQSIDLGDLRKD